MWINHYHLPQALGPYPIVSFSCDTIHTTSVFENNQPVFNYVQSSAAAGDGCCMLSYVKSVLLVTNVHFSQPDCLLFAPNVGRWD